MAKSYPHGHTLVVLCVCLLAITATIWYSHANTQQVQEPLQATPSVDTTVTPVVSSDWKKDFFALSGTTSAPVLKKAATSAESLTVTDKLSKDLLGNLLALKKAGLDTDTTMQQELIDNLLTNAVDNTPGSKSFTSSNILISNDTSVAALRTYGNTMGSVLSSYKPDSDPLEIFTEAMETEDSSVFVRLDPIIVGYQRMLDRAKAVRVPAQLTDTHLNFLNGLSEYIEICQSFRKGDRDAMRSIVNLSAYSETQRQVSDAISTMRNYFTLSRIAFGPSEGGSFFTATR